MTLLRLKSKNATAPSNIVRATLLNDVTQWWMWWSNEWNNTGPRCCARLAWVVRFHRVTSSLDKKKKTFLRKELKNNTSNVLFIG